jgi:hypothetical protein
MSKTVRQWKEEIRKIEHERDLYMCFAYDLLADAVQWIRGSYGIAIGYNPKRSADPYIAFTAKGDFNLTSFTDLDHYYADYVPTYPENAEQRNLFYKVKMKLYNQ